MSYVFLILVFGTANSTVNTTTLMPSMDVCEKMLDYHMDDLPMQPSWTKPGISKPTRGYCKEITTNKPKVN